MPFLVESVIEFQMDCKSRWFAVFWNEVIAQADNFLLGKVFINYIQINDKTNHFKRIIVMNLIYMYVAWEFRKKS